MLENLLRNKTRAVFTLLLVFALALIRFFESKLFYDPFLLFFKSEFQNKPLPEYNSFKLYLNLSFRYFLNSIISLGIIYVLFQSKPILKLSLWLYLLFFVILIVLLFVEINFFKDYLLLFYTRRFLIQPLFLILFIPAFYYQKLTENK